MNQFLLKFCIKSVIKYQMNQFLLNFSLKLSLDGLKIHFLSSIL